jgi:lipopolysaccharide transport system permease protein
MAVVNTRLEEEPLPTLVVHGDRATPLGDALRELVHYGEVLRAFTLRRIKVKYKQAVVGLGWAVLQPLLAAAIFAIFLGQIASVPSEGVPYLLFVLAGTVAWTYFAGATGAAMESLVVDRGLVRKVYFPREIVPLSAVLASLVDLAAGLLVLGVAAAFEGIMPTITWLALPIPVVLLVFTATAVSLFFAAVNVYYRDARHALPFLLQLGMYTAPVLYSLTLIPQSVRGPYSVLNPLVMAVDGLRQVTVHQSWPDFGGSALALLSSSVLLVCSYVIFKRVERGFADHV